MQLNFLQEDLAATLQKSKGSSTSKKTTPVSATADLFGGLPLAMPPGKMQKKAEEKSPAKAEVKLEEKVPAKIVENLAEKPATEPHKKADTAFKTISEAAAILDVPQHVLRFWESRFSQIKPLKMGGGRRYYRPEDIDILSKIHNLLYKQGYTIKGAKKAFNMKEAAQEAEPVTVAKKTAAKPHAEKAAEKAIENTVEKTFVLNERQRKQVSSLRHELIGLRETLRPYLAEKVFA